MELNNGMKRILTPFLLLLFFGLANTSEAQNAKDFKRVEFEPEIHYCPVSFEYDPHYIPRRRVLRPKNFGATFNVDYNNVPAEAQQAFENGVIPILQDFINSPVPINIRINWRDLEGSSLAGASPGAYYSRFPNVPNPTEVYPVALAEKISRRPLNDPEEPDIVISVNSGISWYYDFDLPIGIGNKYDFVSVLLHEVFHGLGFTAVTTVNDNVGRVGVFNGGRRSIYSDFIHNGSRVKITAFEDNSPQMASLLQSGNLFFEFINNGDRAKLFAPSEFNPGSSISHLDELTYNNTPDALMTPSIGPGQVEQDPGIALEMLYDMGWDMLYMIHDEKPGTEDLTRDQLLVVDVFSDSEIVDSSLVIYYSRDTFQNDTMVAPLVLNEATGLYEFTLPAPNEEVNYTYYFTAANSRNVTFTNPGKAPDNYFEFQYRVDDETPSVIHNSPESIQDVEPELVVEAEITDEYLGVDTAFIAWRINGVIQDTVGMERQTGFSEGDTTDFYEGTLILPEEGLAEGDTITYQIIAIDKSKAKNVTVAPDGGFWKVGVSSIQASVLSYVNDFDIPTADFTGDGFSIREYPNFESDAIHSTHPYPESGQGQFRSYTFELSIPVIIREEEPLIEFDEVVIVEIGEPGTSFGDSEFWDYVIVEGKKLGESAWRPFLPGYDSGEQIQWTTAYNSGLNGGPDLFFPRVIDMTENGNFVPGDEVFVRFRLFSDPFANGWGWAIDNLRIQDQLTSVEEFVLEQNFSVYPNPVLGDEVMVEVDLEKMPDALELSVFDAYGRLLQSIPLNNRGIRIRERISLAGYEKGLYVMVLNFGSGDVISKKIIRN
jgi:hypothetical protein